CTYVKSQSSAHQRSSLPSLTAFESSPPTAYASCERSLPQTPVAPPSGETRTWGQSRRLTPQSRTAKGSRATPSATTPTGGINADRRPTWLHRPALNVEAPGDPHASRLAWGRARRAPAAPTGRGA